MVDPAVHIKDQQQAPRYRSEKKYRINHLDYQHIVSRLKHLMLRDVNASPSGSYHVRSLYFDTPENHALYEKLDGQKKREKFRIRFYNGDFQHIKLEKKMKNNNQCLKVSCPITIRECECLLAGDLDFMRSHSEPLIQELYFKMTTKNLAPKTLVDYTREAYTFIPGNVRITFDRNIQTGLHLTDLFCETLPSAYAIPTHEVVMEVKFDTFLPSVIRGLIQTGRNQSETVSKYALSRAYL